MPQHDVIDGVTRYMNRETRLAKQLSPRRDFWQKPEDYLVTLFMFEKHFTIGMSLEEELALKYFKTRVQQLKQRNGM